jgi:tellurite methyltransferase
MSQADREKWDARYREGAYETRTHPSAILTAWSAELPRGRALDIACGAGRNALYLAELGYTVDAVDISAVALERAHLLAEERGVEISWLQADLDTAPLPAATYDLIVWVRYVNRALMATLPTRLAAGGRVLCEQHLLTNEDVVGPRSPAFRLRPGELLAEAAPMHVQHYRESIVVDPDGRRVALAQLLACRGAHTPSG